MSTLLLSEDERMLQQSVREFAQAELAPRAAEVGEQEEFAWDYWKAMAKMGLMGITTPVELGGTGGNYRQLAIVIEELTRGDPAASLLYIAHTSLTLATIERFGTQSQKERWVVPMAKGDKIGAWCLSEPSSGSDAANFHTILRPNENGYVVSGNKTFISNGDVADILVVFATLAGSERHKGTVCIVVDREQAQGLMTTLMPGKMGMHGSSTADVSLQDTRIPTENRIGAEEDGFKIAMSILDSSRVSIAAQGVGVAAEALHLAATYTKQRKAFNRNLAEFQGIQWMLADMAVEVDAARLLTMRAAELKDAGEPHSTEASMAKLFASEVAMRAANKAVQIHGGYGYFRPHPVERLFRDAKVLEIYEGTSEIQRLIIARNLLRGIHV
jgi:butyryl-CoA dehydrogenase